jgi:hypothetical protein
MRHLDWAAFWAKQRPRLVLGILCLLGAVALGRVAVVAQGLQSWQEFWIVFLFSLCLIWAAIATSVARERIGQPVSGENVESILNEWIRRFRFPNQKLADSAGYRFAYRITAPDGQVVIIGKPTTSDSSLRFKTDVMVLERHRRALNDLGEHGRKRFMIEYMSECSRARVHITSARALPFTVRIERTVPITRDLNDEILWAALESMHHDVAIALTHADLCLVRMKETQSDVIVPMTAPSPASGASDVENWSHSPSSESRSEPA